MKELSRLFVPPHTAEWRLIMENNDVKKSENKETIEIDKLIGISIKTPDNFQKNFKTFLRKGSIYIFLLFFVIILVIAGVFAFSVFFKINASFFTPVLLGLLYVIYVLFRALFIKYEPDDCFQIDRSAYPEIFSRIDSAMKKFGLDKEMEVFISDDPTCGVAEIPYGFGTKTQRCLIIGVNLLSLLTLDELEIIFLHEFAHIDNNDTGLTAKFIKNLERWAKIIENCEDRGFLAKKLLADFGSKYIFEMNVYKCFISKSREVYADSCAVKFIDKEKYAQVLLKASLVMYFFSIPKSELGIEVASFSEPPKDLNAFFSREFIKRFSSEKQKWISAVFKRISDSDDSHPSFSERLEFLEIKDFSPEISFDDKAEDDETLRLTAEVDACWYREVLNHWSEITSEYSESKTLAENFEWSDDNDKNFDYAIALENLSRTDESMEVCRAILEKTPDYAPALYKIGADYLFKEDIIGIDYLKSAIKHNLELAPDGIQLISAFYKRNGLRKELEELPSWASRYISKHDEMIEDYDVGKKDSFFEAALSKEQRENLKEKLEALKCLKTVCIVSKKLINTNNALLVMGVISNQSLLNRFIWDYKGPDIEKIAEVLDSMEIDYYTIIDLHDNDFMKKPMYAVKNSMLIDD